MEGTLADTFPRPRKSIVRQKLRHVAHFSTATGFFTETHLPFGGELIESERSRLGGMPLRLLI